ncbi:MAG: hypothetical protein RBU21_22365 [FCB group bacterium]|jgi:hypothetical protein|nr:hypothetical protein [FCB group bacterium]
MDKPISPATRERIRKLCGQITVAHDLDPEIQEELSGHLEDKLHAYLAGEEALSEEDAYMLTRRHFGDVSALKVLLQNVHDRSVRTGLARRLTAALVVTSVLATVAGLVHKMALVCVALWAVENDRLGSFLDVSTVLRLAIGLVFVSLLWYVFARWQRKLARGERPWFVRWTARRMWIAAVAALALPQLVPGLLPGLPEIAPPSASGYFYIVFLTTAEAIPVLLSACAWLWWSDRPPRTPKGMLRASMAWASAQVCFAIYPKLAPVLVIGLAPVTFRGKPLEAFAGGDFFGSALHWLLVWPRAILVHQPSIQNAFLLRLAASTVGIALAALLAWALYSAVSFATSRFAERNVRRQTLA